MSTADEVRAAIAEHVAAFNAHDTARVLAGLSSDVVWSTGTDTFRGTAALETVFDDWLWSLHPSLRVLSLVVDECAAAAELHESLVVDGDRREFDVGGFFTLRDGLITRAAIYREGTADLDAEPLGSTASEQPT